MMRILLFGEFSGLHVNLKKGLEDLGHEATVVSFGDDFKNIKGDITIKNVCGNKLLRLFTHQVQCFKLLKKIKNYDVVQFISIAPHIIPYDILGYFFIKFIKRNNAKVFFNSCGMDTYNALTQLTFAYSPLCNEIREGNYRNLFLYCNNRSLKITNKIVSLFDGIISSSFTYHCGYKRFSNYIGFIPMPFYIVKKDEANLICGKIKIFYGISRKQFKGTRYILDALERISKKYHDQVEISIVENRPFDEYVKLFDQCNIFVDQACSYGYGMNALLGLSKGKVVLSGNESQNQEFIGIKCPIINIEPSSEHIYNEIEKLVLNSENIPLIGREGTEFLNKLHDARIVAMKYVEYWNLANK